jgi:hypothetical protein
MQPEHRVAGAPPEIDPEAATDLVLGFDAFGHDGCADIPAGVGTGFSEKLLRSLFDDLQKIRVETCPFSNLPAPGATDGTKG